ncbi:hypothetical protein [Microcystis aeruginosa]|uniref:hypothetical protein n=1 Tax=Microcystis aeruginosa TaxID=1126 RepID=UPI00077660CB|nr:hypothetical protein [Microcystis aeruginosa]KXS91513.1 hypothetical protein OA58_11435 [Microcystis aeruginosa NIES-88]
MTPSKSLKPYTLHPTLHTLPPGKTFCRKPYLITFNSVPQIVLDLFATTSTLKRKLKPSKSTEKKTTKVG